MPKGKPWTADEEKQLKELISQKKPLNVISSSLGKTETSIRMKLKRLGLKTKEEESPVSQFSSSSRISIPGDLPSVEDVLHALTLTLDELRQPGLSQADVFRLRTIIQGIKTYKEIFADYINYRLIEEKVAEMEEAYERLAAQTESLEKRQPAKVVQASPEKTDD